MYVFIYYEIDIVLVQDLYCTNLNDVKVNIISRSRMMYVYST